MKELIVVLDNIRSTYNVGSIIRTCEGFGVKKLIVCGLTPYPIAKNDQRLPHIAKRAHQQITKTALGAEDNVEITYFETLDEAIEDLKESGTEIWAIEQAKKSAALNETTLTAESTAVILGNEVAGVNMKSRFDKIIEIPMYGQKESFNVSVTAGIVIYQLTQK